LLYEFFYPLTKRYCRMSFRKMAIELLKEEFDN